MKLILKKGKRDSTKMDHFHSMAPFGLLLSYAVTYVHAAYRLKVILIYSTVVATVVLKS